MKAPFLRQTMLTSTPDVLVVQFKWFKKDTSSNVLRKSHKHMGYEEHYQLPVSSDKVKWSLTLKVKTACLLSRAWADELVWPVWTKIFLCSPGLCASV
jgi:hypothetical protein